MTSKQRIQAQLERRARILAQREANQVTRAHYLNCDDLEPRTTGRQYVGSWEAGRRSKRQAVKRFSLLAWIWPF